ncbi:MAG: ABC transporter substrate-binding protein [Clostridiaceae bacterium]|nr:ABC transporter substrate-binding protein [Clostridiaceae bacterium]
MKKFSIIIALILTMSLLISCGNSANDVDTNDEVVEQESEAVEVESQEAEDAETDDSQVAADMFEIGVIQLAPHAALDSGYEGFVDGLAERGFVEGENLTIDYNNAQGDQSNATTIAQKIVNANPNLIFAIATPAAQAVANQTTEIPIVITAVTDAAMSGLVNSNDKPETNVTGTSDLTPVKEQMELIQEILPEAKSVGVIFNSSEDNSLIQAEMAQEKLEELGIEYLELTVSKTDEISQVVQSAMGKVDAIYTPTDNLISANMTAVTNITTPAGVPVICGEAAMLEGGGLLTYGIDYYELGKQSGHMAADILEGKSTPQEMAIQTITEPIFEVNQELADELGIEIPAKYLE